VGHGHGEAPPWRPTLLVRAWLAAALVPFAVVTVVGLVVLWPAHRTQPVPLQFTTYGEGRTVFERGTVVGVSQQSCTASAGSPAGPAGASPGSSAVNSGAAVCGTASVVLGSGPDTGRTVSLGPSSTSFRVGDRVRLARGPLDPTTGAASTSLTTSSATPRSG